MKTKELEKQIKELEKLMKKLAVIEFMTRKKLTEKEKDSLIIVQALLLKQKDKLKKGEQL